VSVTTFGRSRLPGRDLDPQVEVHAPHDVTCVSRYGPAGRTYFPDASPSLYAAPTTRRDFGRSALRAKVRHRQLVKDQEPRLAACQPRAKAAARGRLLFSTQPKMARSTLSHINPTRKRGSPFSPSLARRVSSRFGREEHNRFRGPRGT